MRDKRRRAVEWGKNLLIVLLTLSALLLLSQTPLVQDSGLTELFRPGSSPGGASAELPQAEPILPVQLAVYLDGERCGLQYDSARMEELFSSFGPLLGEALTGAGTPSALSEAEWRGCLQRPGVYFDFSGNIPLAALARWLGGGLCTIEDSARRVALSAETDGHIVLCWQSAGDDGFYTCPTTLSRTLHLDPLMEAVSPNGAYFAFENPELSQILEPCTLIIEGERSGAQYTASAPLSTAAGIEALLDALSFNSRNHAPSSRGEVYPDGSDRLVLRDNGTVVYHAAQGEKYPVENRNGVSTAAQAADGARALAERAMGALIGDARLYLLSVQEEDDGWRVRFGYRLEGSAVYLYDEGWAAEFLVQGGYITDFTLHLRSYTADGNHTLLLPIDKAAAMLPDLTREKRELVIQYRDSGGQTVIPGWEAV